MIRSIPTTGALGIDQRRQTIEAANLESEKVFDSLDEEVHSTKPPWAELSINSPELEEQLADCRKDPANYSKTQETIRQSLGFEGSHCAASAVGFFVFESVRERYAT